jgi:hypothetical protein
MDTVDVGQNKKFVGRKSMLCSFQAT